jgi:hypothetical protein
MTFLNDLWNKMRKEHQDMLKLWAQVFASTLATLFLVGETNISTLLKAGVAAVIPLFLTWADPSDYRFGKMKSVAKPVTKAPAKKSSKSAK